MNDKMCNYCYGIGKITILATKEVYDCDVCDGSGKFNESAYTCNECRQKDICCFAWNPYNTNGDCLIEK